MVILTVNSTEGSSFKKQFYDKLIWKRRNSKILPVKMTKIFLFCLKFNYKTQRKKIFKRRLKMIQETKSLEIKPDIKEKKNLSK